MVLEARNEELNCESLVVPVGEDVFGRCTQWCHNDAKVGDWVLFGDMQVAGTAYLLVHGTPTGKMLIGRDEVSTEQWLMENAEDLIAKGVDTVLTIACYGSLHRPIMYKGVTMKSLHDNTFEIYVETFEKFPMVFQGERITDFPRIKTVPVLRISRRLPTDGKFSRWFKDMFDKIVSYKYSVCPRKTMELK